MTLKGVCWVCSIGRCRGLSLGTLRSSNSVMTFVVWGDKVSFEVVLNCEEDFKSFRI